MKDYEITDVEGREKRRMTTKQHSQRTKTVEKDKNNSVVKISLKIILDNTLYFNYNKNGNQNPLVQIK